MIENRDLKTGRIKTKHGLGGTRVSTIWRHMIQRCHNPNCASYEDYGLQGITVCSRWKNILNFYKDMGEPPDGYSLDRIDSDYGYTPWNCRWADKETQILNRSITRWITYKDKTLSISQWAKELKINYHTLYMRLKRGWSMDKILDGVT